MPKLVHHFTRPSLKYSSPRARRKGQALLLAVLILIFAALLGTTFIAVVAINIGQTSRNEERDKARVAAQAGLDFANAQLTYGLTATRWQPSDVNHGGNLPPASTTDPTYYTYWTPFDEAQGWNAAGFVKFPDPRSTNQNLSAPNYMLKVERVNSGDADNADNTKTGMIRITSIGLSSDDPNSFYTLTAYKAGPAQSPLTAAMRTITNWNFSNNTVPTAETISASSGTTLTLQNVSGDFPTKNFYVMIGTGASMRSAFVLSYNSATKVITFASSQTWATNERIELASVLGAPPAVDYDRDGTPNPTIEKVNYQVSQNGMPGGIRANGSLIVEGSLLSQNLHATNSSGLAGRVEASGLIQVSGTNAEASGTIGATNISGTLFSSSSTNFPVDGAGTASEKLELIRDGANRIANIPTTERQVKPFTPPNIASTDNGLDRYRHLTKYSDPASDSFMTTQYPGISSSSQAAAFGYGKGLYINNPEDFEKKGTGVAGQYVAMTQDQLRDLWFRAGPDGTSRELRVSDPASYTTTTASLEEQHFRGWVGPNEFLPRGALVELDPAAGLVHVTLDAKLDGRGVYESPTPSSTSNVYANEGPIANKSWKAPDGTLQTAGTCSYGPCVVGGTYRQSFSWPANGVIFAEGNIRIRGGSFDNSGNYSGSVDPGRSLTVVSMNNIYIEGSLNAGGRKLMLLAKKNVVVNPTQVIARVEGMTRLSADTNTGAGSNFISVSNSAVFRAGDTIEIGINKLRRQVTNIVGNGLTLNVGFDTSLDPNDRAVQGEVVQLIPEPLLNVGDDVDPLNDVPFSNYATRLSRFGDVLHRRILLPQNVTEKRIALRHSAERRLAVKIPYTDGDGEPSEVMLGHKVAANAATSLINRDEKLITTLDGGTPLDTWGIGTLTSPEKPTDFTLNWLADAPSGKVRERYAPAMVPPVPLWYYADESSATNLFLNDYGGAAGSPRPPNIPPYYFLAAVGNRYEFGAATPGAFPFRKDVKPLAATGYDIPMATSVVMQVNANNAIFRSPVWDATNSVYEQVGQLGFNPIHGALASPATPTEEPEDVLTVDQSFYSNGTSTRGTASYDNVNYTLDSRTLLFGSISDGANRLTLNSLAVKLNNSLVDGTLTVENYFRATSSDALPPYYRLSRIKLENVQENGDHEFETLEPGYDLDIRAYVYAQEGSWVVIPGGYFDDKIRTDGTGSYYDLNGNSTRDSGETNDLNRDGLTASRTEQAAAHRYSRYNYQINFVGAIMENRTATVNDPDGAGNLIGEVSDWVDKWATTAINSGNWASSTGAFSNNLSTASGNFATINYEFDDDAALDMVDSDITDPNLKGWRPPVSPELIYQSG